MLLGAILASQFNRPKNTE